MTKQQQVTWLPWPKGAYPDGDDYWAERAWGVADSWLGDFGIGLGTPDAFVRDSGDVFRFRIDSAGKSIVARVEVSWRDADDSRDYCVRVEVSRG